MKTLAVFYSKTGNTKKAAEAVIKALDCDCDEIFYDEPARKITYSKNPSDYERVILLCPIWAFSLPEPMKLYLGEQKGAIENYSLIVTCGMFGLGGCVKGCRTILGRLPAKKLKIRARQIAAGDFDVSPAL